MSRKLLGLAFLVFHISISLHAQAVRNVKATIKDGNVEVRYDLIAPDRNYEFSIELFASYNNYATPLRQVKGDVGGKVNAGEGKLIIWSPKGELVNYKGDVQFEIRAKSLVLVPPIRFALPTGGSKVKVGGRVAVKWEGGDPKETLRLELVQGIKLIKDYGSISNIGSTTVDLDTDLVPGDFQLKLIGYEGEIYSPAFVVRKKSSPWIKIIPAAILLGVGAAVLGGGGGGGSGGAKELPVAPEPN